MLTYSVWCSRPLMQGHVAVYEIFRFVASGEKFHQRLKIRLKKSDLGTFTRKCFMLAFRAWLMCWTHRCARSILFNTFLQAQVPKQCMCADGRHIHSACSLRSCCNALHTLHPDPPFVADEALTRTPAGRARVDDPCVWCVVSGVR